MLFFFHLQLCISLFNQQKLNQAFLHTSGENIILFEKVVQIICTGQSGPKGLDRKNNQHNCFLIESPDIRESKHSFIIIIINNNFAEICVSIVIVMDIPIIRRVVRLLYLWEAILMALPARVILIVIKILLRKSPIIIIYVNLEVCNNTRAV